MRMGSRARRAGWTARGRGRPWLAAPAAATLALIAVAAAARAQDPPLGFSDAVHLATQQTSLTRVAALRTSEAESRVKQARGLLLPDLSGSASDVNRTANLKASGLSLPSAPGLSVPDLIGPYDVIDARLSVRQPVIAASDWYHLRSAHAGVAGAVADADAAAEQAAQGAAMAYLRAAAAQALVTAREADVGIAEELLSLARWQQQAGTSPAIDTTRARTEVVAAQGGLLLARNAVGRNRIDLARAIGADPASPPVLTDSLSEMLGASDVPTDTAAVVAFAIAHRPEIVSEQAKLGRSRSERTAIQSELVPRLDVIADWGLSGASWDEAFPTREYGAAVSVPLVDGFRRQARVSEQRSIEHESEVRIKDLKDQVAAEVSTALLDFAAGNDQLRIADERVALAEAELAQARERFTTGVSGNIEVINAQSSLVRARDVQIAARLEIAAARVSIARAAGVARTLR